MESLLDKILSYLAHHSQDLANYGTTASALITLILVIITGKQLRGAKLNREVALAQLEVTERQEITAREQGVAARGQQRASHEAVDQQKRSARIAEEAKLDSQAPDLAIIEYGPVKSKVGGHQRWREADYDWVFSEENSLILPDRFSIELDSDYRWWTIWVAGSLLIRNEGSRTVLFSPAPSHRWVGDAPLKSRNLEYIISPGDEFKLEWFNIHTIDTWRFNALGSGDDKRLGVNQKDNIIMITSPHLPGLYDVCSIEYTWYPMEKAFGSDNEFLFFDRPPQVVIKKRRCYPSFGES